MHEQEPVFSPPEGRPKLCSENVTHAFLTRHWASVTRTGDWHAKSPRRKAHLRPMAWLNPHHPSTLNGVGYILPKMEIKHIVTNSMDLGKIWRRAMILFAQKN